SWNTSTTASSSAQPTSTRLTTHCDLKTVRLSTGFEECNESSVRTATAIGAGTPPSPCWTQSLPEATSSPMTWPSVAVASSESICTASRRRRTADIRDLKIYAPATTSPRPSTSHATTTHTCGAPTRQPSDAAATANGETVA